MASATSSNEYSPPPRGRTVGNRWSTLAARSRLAEVPGMADSIRPPAHVKPPADPDVRRVTPGFRPVYSPRRFISWCTRAVLVMESAWRRLHDQDHGAAERSI